MDYLSWLEQVPTNLKNDPAWEFIAYPKSLLLFDLAWQDCKHLKSEPEGKALINQLIRSSDSISANIDEGIGRGIEEREYHYFLRIALGFARETRSRYFKIRHILPAQVVQHRLVLCDEIIALLTTTIKKHRPKPPK